MISLAELSGESVRSKVYKNGLKEIIVLLLNESFNKFHFFNFFLRLDLSRRWNNLVGSTTTSDLGAEILQEMVV